MSNWTGGYEEYPWCPCDSKCVSGTKEADLCSTCQAVFTAMNYMEYALLQEKKRADQYAEDAWKYRDLCK